MANKKFDRTTKTIIILLAICFLLSVTVASAKATANDKYRQGYNVGYSKGSHDGKKDCDQHGNKEVLKKIPTISNNDQTYINSFKIGYITGYNEKRYSCLKKK